jgi:hypothetical protein
MKSTHDLFNRMKLPVLDCVLQHAESPKVAQIQVWPIRWVQNTIKLQIVKFIGHLATIVTHGIVHVLEKAPDRLSGKFTAFC